MIEVRSEQPILARGITQSNTGNLAKCVVEEANSLVDSRWRRSFGHEIPHPPPDVGGAAETPLMRLGIEERGHLHHDILPTNSRWSLLP